MSFVAGLEWNIRCVGRRQKVLACGRRDLESRERALDLSRRIFEEEEVEECAGFFRGRLADEARVRLGQRQNRLTTYGELDFELFLRLVEECQPREGEVFVDVGCGVGRLVLAASIAFPQWKYCIGVEIIDDLVGEGVRYLEAAKGEMVEEAEKCLLLHGDYEQMKGFFKDKDVIFAYATTWGEDRFSKELVGLSRRLGDELKSGSRVVIVDKTLNTADGFTLLNQIHGINYDTGESVGYVYTKV